MKLLSFLHTVVVNNDERRSEQSIETDDYVISVAQVRVRANGPMCGREQAGLQC